MEYHFNCEEETMDFAASFAAGVPLGAVVALHGELGAGKSVFARGFARGLGVTGPIPSPTFVLMHEYEIPPTLFASSKGGTLYHLDLYRIPNEDAALAFGVDELLANPNAIKIIEWPEKIGGLLPPGSIHVYLTHAGDSARNLAIAR